MLPTDTYTRLMKLQDVVDDVLGRLVKLENLAGEPTVKFKKLKSNAVLPEYQSSEATGMDLRAYIDSPSKTFVLYPEERVKIDTGLAIELPRGYEGQIRPRSGLAANKGITVLNSPGSIDADFKGHVQILLINHSAEPFAVVHGDRIAQLVVAKSTHASVVEAEYLTETERGEGGFGSSGIK